MGSTASKELIQTDNANLEVWHVICRLAPGTRLLRRHDPVCLVVDLVSEQDKREVFRIMGTRMYQELVSPALLDG